jgi:hypothetical protein
MPLLAFAFLLMLLVPAAVASDLDKPFDWGPASGFDPKYERDYNIFNPINQLSCSP